MEQYRINDLEKLTGIKAHTIRIWEKRYSLIEPSRTSTNRRFYNSTQLLKLMNISTLLAQGHKISNLAALSDQDIKTSIEQLQHSSSSDALIANFISDLTYAMLNFDEQHFEKVYAAVIAKLGLYEGTLQVLYPFLKNTGVLWRVNKTLPVEEHFASAIIRKKLIAATEGLPFPVPGSKKFLLFLPAEEWHEVGLLFGNYILRSKGCTTIYLGQNVPSGDIERIYNAVKPDFLLTFFISPKPADDVTAEIAAISKVSGATPLLVAGSKEMLTGVKFQAQKIVILKDVGSLAQYF